MRTLTTSATARRGLTLVEAALSSTLLAVLLSGLTILMVQSQRAMESERTVNEVADLSHRVLNRMADALQQARRDSLDPLPDSDFGSDRLRYRRSLGFQAGAPLAGPPTELLLELEPGELENGLDDDGDGLTDEHRLVWREDPGGPAERSVVWASGVASYLEGELPNLADDNGNGLIDERGLAFRIEGPVLTLHLSLETPGLAGEPVIHTVRTSVRLQN